MQTSTKVKKSITGFLFLSGLLAGLVSCQKEKDNSPETPPAALRIKEFKTGEEFIRFDYNTTGDVNKVTINSDVNTGGSVVTYTVNYDAGKKIASLEADEQKIIPVYENNLLKRADIFESDERIGYANYQFENGLLKIAALYFGQGTVFHPLVEFRFSYNATGNITETVVMMANGVPGQMVRSGHITYQYDQKTNPLYAQRDLLAIFWQAASKNNIQVEDHFDSNLQPDDKLVYEYQYDNNGLPKTAVVTQGLPGQPTTTNNLSFTYQ